jgi:hypothetical protein
MKYILACVLLYIIHLRGYSQIPVTDIALGAQLSSMNVQMQIQSQRKGLLDKLRHSETIQKSLQAIDFAKKSLATAREVKNELESIYALQEELKRAMESVENVKNFTFGDLNYFSMMLADMDLNPASYIPNVPETRGYINDLNKTVGGNESSRSLFYSYHSLNRINSGMQRIYNEHKEKKEKRDALLEQKALALAMEEQQGQLMMELVTIKNREIQKNLQDAAKLKNMATDDKIIMTESDRVMMNEESKRLMQEAFELRLEVSQLLGQINSFENRPLTKSLFETSVRTTMSMDLSKVAYSKINRKK